MYTVDMIKGKDELKKIIVLKEHGDKGGSIFGILLRLVTKELYNSGKLVILDSGFCVSQALIELRKGGVFASAVIKKRQYC